jgi:energy-coupling factor transport system ATP-binding protein
MTVDGLDVNRAPGPEIARRVGLVFQDPASQLVMDRVEDDVAFGLENRAWSRDDMRRRVPEALADMGLAELARARVAILSGGQQQRAALAGVIAPRPGVLVLDEPTANLDPPAAAAFVARLAAIRERRSATVVLIEHRVDLVWDLADLLLVLGGDGRPIAFGSPDAVIGRSGRATVDAGVWLPRAIEHSLGVAPLRIRMPPPGLHRGDGAGGDGADGDGAGGGGSPGTGAGAALIEARHLEFAYEPGVPVLRDVSLDVQSGERIALVGPNGSGKSTLGKLLVGLLKPGRGRVELFAAGSAGPVRPDRVAAALLARIAGYVFQDPERQFLASRVLDEVMLGLGPEERGGLAGLMESLGLPLAEFGGRSPYALSGGEQRRLSLASCLVRTPRVLVLDEPTFGQDRHGYEALLAILRDRIDDGAAVIAATHDERLVADFGERVVSLENGRIVADRARASPVAYAAAGTP